LKFNCSRIDSTFGDHQNPAQKGGFVNITGVVAKQLAGNGFSGEM
jgi:hypothetical protein